MKRIVSAILSSLMLISTAVSLTACSSGEGNGGTVNISIGVQDTDISPVVAEKMGYFDQVFKEKGIDAKVELVTFDAGPSIMEAFSANSLDFGCLGDQPCISALATGCPAEIIGTYRTQKTGSAIIVRKDSGIETPEDLKGKKVALTVGSNVEHLFNIVLADYGLTQNDLEVVQMQQGDMVSALQGKNVDAAAVWEPRIAQTSDICFRLADGEGVYDKDGNQTKKADYKFFCNPLAANKTFTQEHPDITAAVLKAISMGADYTDSNTDEAIKMLAEKFDLDIEAATPSVICEERDVKITDEKIDAFKSTVDFLIDTKVIDTSDSNCVIKSADDIEKFINTSYYDEAGIE